MFAISFYDTSLLLLAVFNLFRTTTDFLISCPLKLFVMWGKRKALPGKLKVRAVMWDTNLQADPSIWLIKLSQVSVEERECQTGENCRNVRMRCQCHCHGSINTDNRFRQISSWCNQRSGECARLCALLSQPQKFSANACEMFAFYLVLHLHCY